MNQPMTIRLSSMEKKALKRVTGTSNRTEAIKILLQQELERENQIRLWKKIYGKMKPEDFDDSTL